MPPMKGRPPGRAMLSHFLRAALALLSLAGLAASLTAAQEQDPDPSEESSSWTIEIDVPILSQYVFRGVVLNDEAVLQPQIFAYHEWSDGAWAGAGLFLNTELTNYSGRAGEITEVDWCAEGGLPTSLGWFSTGVATYTYPDHEFASTSEAFIAWEADCEGLIPRLELWYDFDQGDGFYARAESCASWAWADSWTACVTAGIGAMDRDYADYTVGAAVSGLADLGACAQLSWVWSESTAFVLCAAASTLLDRTYRDAVSDPDPLWIGLSCNFAF